MEGLGINLGYLVVQVFNFLIILVILIAWMYRPLINMLEERRERIAKGLEDARVASEARENAEQEADQIIAKAQQEASKLVRESTERGEEVRREIKENAEQEAAEIRATAHDQAQEVKEQALSDLRGQVASLAISAAQKVIGEALDEKRQRALIEQFFSGVKEGKVVLIDEESLSGGSAEVTSALPLTDEEQQTIRDDIVGKLGDTATITFRVDPNILGGLVIRVGDKVLDGSVAGKLSGLSQSLR
ncbi:MAG: F0F1 ATP synthase subunit B [Anaerolineales bacterium]